MRARSWMAALALIGGTSIAVGRALPPLVAGPTQAQGQPQAAVPPEPPAPTSQSTSPEGRIKSVQLNLVVAGLTPDGCDIEVKPGNASCRFRVFNDAGKESRQHVPSSGRAQIELRDVELRGADRTVTVALIVRERGQGSRTIYRGFRLPAREKAAAGGNAAATAPIATAAPAFTCYLSALRDSRESKRHVPGSRIGVARPMPKAQLPRRRDAEPGIAGRKALHFSVMGSS